MRNNIQELGNRKQINKVVRYIQHHLDEDFTLTGLAAIAGFSPHHFHRIFAAYVGETLNDYLRRLRLEYAAGELIHTQKNIVTIALESGYKTHAAFSKSFRKCFATNPSQVRERGLRPQFISKYKKEIIRSTHMQTEIRELPERKVISVRKTGAAGNVLTPAADKAFDVLCKFLTKNKSWGKVGECIGICPDDPIETTPESCRYDGGFVIKQGAEISPSGEVKIQILPAGKYAVFFIGGITKRYGKLGTSSTATGYHRAD